MNGEPAERTLLVWMLRRASRRFAGAVKEALSSAGFSDLTQRGMWAVQALHGHDCSATELVTAMQITKQAVSALVEELAAKSYVERSPDDVDRRRTVLRLTDRGAAAARLIEQTCLDVEHSIERDLGSKDISRLRRILAVLGEQRPI